MVSRVFLEGVESLLDTPKRIAVVSHKNPDGDAIGSSLAVFHYLRKKGHDTKVVMPGDYPDFLKWLPGERDIVNFADDPLKVKEIINNVDIVFTLDFNTFSRVDKMAGLLSSSHATFVMIDHHEKPDNYAEYVFSDTEKGSTSEMIYDFVEAMGDLPLVDSDLATCIYTGIMTDSGSFRFPKTTSRTHRIVASLIDCGADNTSIHFRVYDQNNLSKIRLIARALDGIKILSQYNTALITLTAKQMSQLGYKKGDTEGIVNYGLSIKHIKMAAFFTESMEEKGLIKMSFRSKEDFDVNTFARECFGGGGHFNAAGAAVRDTIDNVVKHFIAHLERVHRHQTQIV